MKLSNFETTVIFCRTLLNRGPKKNANKHESFKIAVLYRMKEKCNH